MKWIEKLQWMGLGAVIISVLLGALIVSVLPALGHVNANPYQRETRNFADQIIKIEKQAESIQNMSFKDDLCFAAYTKQLQLLTRDYIKRMGALRILDK